ncbi:hypothetical protein [Falsirhodobacter sp. 1013]|uniref:hypothetical protein n=1 Tax=Falsirhodobacter sp. 1013 TaxID=3417566 RepID=UPI003EBC3146
MIVQALKQVGMAFGAARTKLPTPSDVFFEVQLIGDALGRFGAVPLTITTTRPQEVAGELMRDRDPRQWDVQIRAVGPRRMN